MKKVLILVMLLTLITAFTNASAFEFEKEAINNVITQEAISIPASYTLTITSAEDDDSFNIYSIITLNLLPTESFTAGTNRGFKVQGFYEI